jgi:ketosteroid isomerase-like protein
MKLSSCLTDYEVDRMDSSKLMLIALKFNEKINLQDLEGLAELMTEDHTFIDNSGQITKGKEVMKEGWRQFFKKYPDYRNIFSSVVVQDNVVVMVGYSKCSYKPLDGPSIWTAKVQQGLVSEWRVYWLGER